ncbi:MAG: GNAT family N-acetyltransferase [Alcanivoracaceae bacterium]|nr:GNAT family N-acetyltransferase [Alcanivoracaceae bacterium]
MKDQLISIRPMLDEDLDSILEIIEEHDEDDAQEAQRDYQDVGISGQYVILYDNKVIGVTGAKRVEACDNTFKLSWTYVDKQYCGKGYGRQLLQHLLDEITSCNGRKIFVYVSDYIDEEGVAIYAAALGLYQSLGFETELKIEDYYDKTEALTVLGLVLKKPASDQVSPTSESPKIVFKELYPVAETENTYSFSWKTKVFGKPFSAQDVKIGIQAALDVKANIVLISFPSNFDNVTMPLFEAGFSQLGQLKDYYEDGIHEDHYAFRL